MKTELLITPGSEQIRATIERDGLLADLEAIGATVLANACGPCIGQWERDRRRRRRAQHDRQLASTATSRSATTARPTRSASSPRPTRSWRWHSPARLDFDPTTDTITDADGNEVLLDAPVGEVLPDKGYDPGENTFIAPPADGSASSSRSSPDQRASAAAAAVRRRGTATTTSTCRS